jgi:hypothetical protein
VAALGILRILVMGDTAQLTTSLADAQAKAQRAGEGMRHAFDGASNSLSTLAGGLTNLPSLLLGAGLGFAVTQILHFADALEESANRLGLTTDAYQALSAQAREAGASTQQFERGIVALNTALGQAHEGVPEAVAKFVKLGVAYDTAAGKTRQTEGAFRDIIKKISEIPVAADRSAAAVEWFGAKIGAALIAAFAGGPAAIDAFEKRMRDTGSILDEHIIAKLAKLQDRLDQLSIRLQVLAANLLQLFGPALETMVDKINAAVTAVQGFARAFGWASDNAESAWAKVGALNQQLALMEKIPLMPKSWIEFTRAQRDAQELIARTLDKQEALAAAKRKADQEEKTRQPKKEYIPKGATPEEQLAALAKIQAMDDEARALGNKFIEEEQKKEEALSAAKIAGWDSEAKAKQELNDEIGKLNNEARLKEAADAQAESDLKVRIVEDEQRKIQHALETFSHDADMLRKQRDEQFEKEEEERWQHLLDPMLGSFQAVERAVSTSVTGIIQGTITAQQAFQKMGQSIVLSIQETIIKQGIEAIGKALQEMVTRQNVQLAINLVLRLFSGTGGGAGAPGSADVAAAQEGGVVTGPTLLHTGEAGPEAIIPLDKWSDFTGGQGVTVNIIDQRKSGQIEQRESRGANGEPQLDVVISDIVNSGIQAGSFDQAFAGTFGLSRRGAAR